jgi:hypothetical protein
LFGNKRPFIYFWPHSFWEIISLISNPNEGLYMLIVVPSEGLPRAFEPGGLEVTREWMHVIWELKCELTIYPTTRKNWKVLCSKRLVKLTTRPCSVLPTLHVRICKKIFFFMMERGGLCLFWHMTSSHVDDLNFLYNIVSWGWGGRGETIMWECSSWELTH